MKKQIANPLPQIGVGLRMHYYRDIQAGLSQRASDATYSTPMGTPGFWFEALSENFMGIQGFTGGLPLARLLRLRKDFPIALHGVSLSIASADAINWDYIRNLKTLHETVQPFLISDHLCFTGVARHNVHDLLPFPFDENTLRHVSERVLAVQDYLKKTITLENVSSYLSYRSSTLDEWEFLKALVQNTSCQILLDINNVFVSSQNHHWNPYVYIESLPKEAVAQYHLAGHTDKGRFLFDTHDQPITDDVWKLYRYALKVIGKRPTLIEWDDHFPAWSTLMSEVIKANHYWNEDGRISDGIQDFASTTTL